MVAVHDAEEDHAARRSQLTLAAYMLAEPARVRAGAGAVAGDHVIMTVDDGRGFVLLAHLRRGSVTVRTGDIVTAGQTVGACGNSGNSTQPHLHLQVMDRADPYEARGLPIAFRRYQVVSRRGGSRVVSLGVPANSEVLRPA